MVKILIEAGANVNQSRIDNGSTALMVAIEKGKTEVVKILIEAGADI
jgi:ankyrin repeat protein